MGTEPCFPPQALQDAQLCLPLPGAGYGQEEGQPPSDALSHSSKFAPQGCCAYTFVVILHSGENF